MNSGGPEAHSSLPGALPVPYETVSGAVLDAAGRRAVDGSAAPSAVSVLLPRQRTPAGTATARAVPSGPVDSMRTTVSRCCSGSPAGTVPSSCSPASRSGPAGVARAPEADTSRSRVTRWTRPSTGSFPALSRYAMP